MILSDSSGIQFFKLIGRHIIAVTVNANGVVESLYVLKNEPVGVVVILNAKPVQPFTLDKRMEGFNARIVVWVAFVAVAEIEFFGSLPICLGNILAASIGMENKRQVGISGILCYFGGTKEIFFVSLLGIILGVITVFISLLTGFTGLVACILLVIFAIVCNVCFSDSNKFFRLFVVYSG